MSLINEALKRARQESRRREALAKGVPLAQPSRSAAHRSWLAAAVVALALALLLSLATILRLAKSERDSVALQVPTSEGIRTSATTDDSVSSPRTGAQIESPEGRVPVPEAHEESSGSADAGPVPPTATEEGLGPDREAAPAGDPEPPSASPSESVTGPAPSPPAQAGLANPPAEGVSLLPRPTVDADESVPAASPGRPQVFVGRAALAGGETLELGGIAWSETGPYALLDNRVVGLGESVMGYIVTRIAPHEVELEGAGEAILIRLK